MAIKRWPGSPKGWPQRRRVSILRGALTPATAAAPAAANPVPKILRAPAIRAKAVRRPVIRIRLTAAVAAPVVSNPIPKVLRGPAVRKITVRRPVIFLRLTASVPAQPPPPENRLRLDNKIRRAKTPHSRAPLKRVSLLLGGMTASTAVAAATNRIRFPVQTSAMGVGGMLGGNRTN